MEKMRLGSIPQQALTDTHTLTTTESSHFLTWPREQPLTCGYLTLEVQYIWDSLPPKNTHKAGVTHDRGSNQTRDCRVRLSSNTAGVFEDVYQSRIMLSVRCLMMIRLS